MVGIHCQPLAKSFGLCIAHIVEYVATFSGISIYRKGKHRDPILFC